MLFFFVNKSDKSPYCLFTYHEGADLFSHQEIDVFEMNFPSHILQIFFSFPYSVFKNKRYINI